MINITNQFSSKSDFKVVLLSKNSKLANRKNFLDLKISDQLFAKALKNKRGFSFISSYEQRKFVNYYFFNIEKNKFDFEYQDIGGSIIEEAMSISKKNIEITFEFLPKDLKKSELIYKNIIIGLLSRNYNFKNYKLKDNSKTIQNITLINDQKNIIIMVI